ncbi:MAG: hypothetical protein QRY72_04995 [Candidatus Rhabdochlamydia sp.]
MDQIPSTHPDEARKSVTDEELLTLFQKGFIPGPKETEDLFLERINNRPSLHHEAWKDVHGELQTNWGFQIDWVPIISSQKSLLFWEGAAFWSEARKTPWIQIHPAMKKRRWITRSYNALLAHEAVHAARETFEEPGFEESLAYLFSSSQFEKIVAPCIHHSYELIVITLLIALFWVAPVVISCCLFYFIARGILQTLTFYRAQLRCPFSALVCLTDQEMRATGLWNQPLIFNGSLRHRLLTLLHPEIFR